MMDPRYREVEAGQIPDVTLDDGTLIRIVSGTVAGTQGPVRDIVTDPVYLDVTIPPWSRHMHATKPEHTVFAYVIEGKGYFCDQMDPFTYDEEGLNYFDMQRDPFLGNGMLVLFDEGDQIMIATEEEAVRFLLVSGRPIGEPVAWYGPIVMNTEEELRIAFEEYRNGTFLKHGRAEHGP
jgi:redox-sensitive bicupin YhaK (pirin superfamily)